MGLYNFKKIKFIKIPKYLKSAFIFKKSLKHILNLKLKKYIYLTLIQPIISYGTSFQVCERVFPYSSQESLNFFQLPVIYSN